MSAGCKIFMVQSLQSRRWWKWDLFFLFISYVSTQCKALTLLSFLLSLLIFLNFFKHWIRNIWKFPFMSWLRKNFFKITSSYTYIYIYLYTYIYLSIYLSVYLSIYHHSSQTYDFCLSFPSTGIADVHHHNQHT
jgi:hypothetical protein